MFYINVSCIIKTQDNPGKLDMEKANKQNILSSNKVAIRKRIV